MFDRALFNKQKFDKNSANAAGVYGYVSGSASLSLLPYLHVLARLEQDIQGRSCFRLRQLCARVPVGAVDIAGGMVFDYTSGLTNARVELRPQEINAVGDVSVDFMGRLSISASIGTGGGMEVDPILRSRVPVGFADFAGAGELLPKAVLAVPLGVAELALKGAIADDLMRTHVPITNLEIVAHGTVQSVSIVGLGGAALTLENINLAPGQELVIDTDTMEIFVDGAEDVSSITYDSEFFQLLPGENYLVFRDGESGRTLSVGLIFSARWL